MASFGEMKYIGAPRHHITGLAMGIDRMIMPGKEWSDLILKKSNPRRYTKAGG